MKRNLKLIGVAVVCLVAGAFAFQNCSPASFKQVEQEMAAPGAQSPNEQTPAPQETPLEFTPSGPNVCSHPMFPLPLKYYNRPQWTWKQDKPNANYEFFIFGMYNASNSTHAEHVLRPQGLPGHRYASVMNVVIPPGTKPVYIIVSAYEPTLWKFSGAVGRVVRAMAVGYHCQVLDGISGSTRTYEQDGVNIYWRQWDTTEFQQKISAFESEFGKTATHLRYNYEMEGFGFTYTASP